MGNHLEHHQVVLVESAAALERNHHVVRNAVALQQHAALAYGLLVDGHVDGIGRNDVQVAIGVAHPVVDDVAQLEGLVAKLLACLLGLLAIELQQLSLERRVYLHVLVGAGAVLQSLPGDGQRGRIVGWAHHLVDVPVGCQIRQVAHAGVSTHALHILVVPEGEGVVVAVGEYDWVARLLQRHQVVLSEVAAGVAARAVVVVPGLRGHLYGHQQAGCSYDRSQHEVLSLELAADEVDDGSHTHAAPDGERIERAGIGIVALTRLQGCLVQVDHDGQTRHKEQEEHHPELLDAFLSACHRLPEQSEQSEQQRQAVEHVVALVLLQVVGQVVLIAQSGVVYEGNATNPVAMLSFAVTLNVVLSSCKVPHEVAPVHEVALVADEEAQVVPLAWHVHHDVLATAVEGHVVARRVVAAGVFQSQPALVEGYVVGSCTTLGAIHAWEEHVLCILVFVLGAHDEVRVLLVGTCLLLALVYGLALRRNGSAVAAVGFELHLRAVGLSPEQGARAILDAAQVVAQGEDVLGRVLVHGRVGARADHDERVGRVAHHQHQHAEQYRILQTGRYDGLLLVAAVQHVP